MIAEVAKIDLKVLAAPLAGRPTAPSDEPSIATLAAFPARPAGARTVSGRGLALERAIPVFHRWIQERVLDELMVDVADYTHVPDGPGVVLVCHDAIYALDSAGGELGLLYSRRRETHPSPADVASLDDRLGSVFRRALKACQLLEREQALGGLRFPGDRFQLAINDRRVSSGDAAELREALDRLVAWVFPDQPPTIDLRGGGEGERLSATLVRARGTGVSELLARLDVGATAARIS